MKRLITNPVTTACRAFISVGIVGLALSSCTSSTSTLAIESASPSLNVTKTTTDVSRPAWANGFEAANWMEPWGIRTEGDWGLQNIEVMKDPSRQFSKVLRVRYPAGSASPSVSQRERAPLGGAQFFADLGMPPKDSLRLSYSVRFSEDFDFVKGGKLPGLFGGSVNTGGNIPDGTNGFSTRYMWRRNGDGEVYAYLPTSKDNGTSLGRGNWRFEQGTWHHLEQEVVLNQPGQKNGRIRVWVDGEEVLNEDGLVFRTTNDLKIEGVLFSTFFGGGDPSWATPKNVYADFADFSVSSAN